jgi:CDP-paratose 2-epimerase
LWKVGKTGNKTANPLKILVTGACGFVGSTLIQGLLENQSLFGGPIEIVGLDNFSRPGSKQNEPRLEKLGVDFRRGDIRHPDDLANLPAVDWILDCAANPSVLAGTTKDSSSRELIDNNLIGTINLLELCKKHKSGFLLLSTSRVYSIPPLASLSMLTTNDAFALDTATSLPPGISNDGISESFSTTPPLSLYGASKLTSETLALEYGHCFDFPVWINRCGVLAGAGQFGRADQGIFSFWINSHLRRAPLRYLGFNGSGHQTRDCLHPNDLLQLLAKQIQTSSKTIPPICNLGGGPTNAMSLKQLTSWCNDRFGTHQIESARETRPFDLPWVAMDTKLAQAHWNWKPQAPLDTILREIANHADDNPNWLSISQG